MKCSNIFLQQAIRLSQCLLQPTYRLTVVCIFSYIYTQMRFLSSSSNYSPSCNRHTRILSPQMGDCGCRRPRFPCLGYDLTYTYIPRRASFSRSLLRPPFRVKGYKCPLKINIYKKMLQIQGASPLDPLCYNIFFHIFFGDPLSGKRLHISSF